MKTKRFVNGFRNLAWCMLPCILIFYACDQAEDVLPRTKDEGRPVHLSVSCENTSYSSDSEILPMRTKGAEDPYIVTQLENHVLFILKRVDNGWVIVEKREDVILSKDNKVLWNGESLTLGDNARQYILSPGKYRFLLFVNLWHDNRTNVIGDCIPDDLPLGEAPMVTSSNNPPADFFFAEDYIEVSKTEKLEQANDHEVHLKLERKSALIRFILEGDWKLSFNKMPTVFCTVSGQEVSGGFDILGRQVIENIEMGKDDAQIDIKTDTPYPVGGQNWSFSSMGLTRNNLQLFADNKKRKIQLNVISIGNKNQSLFEGNYSVDNIEIQENRITTLLIRKDGPDRISIELNPTIDDWDDNTYPPLDYIELNNN